VTIGLGFLGDIGYQVYDGLSKDNAEFQRRLSTKNPNDEDRLKTALQVQQDPEFVQHQAKLLEEKLPRILYDGIGGVISTGTATKILYEHNEVLRELEIEPSK
jgi:hypothetical protein